MKHKDQETSILEKFKNEIQKMKELPPKKRLVYFWDYYKLHTLAVVLIVIVVASFLHTTITHKEYAYYGALVNASDNSYESDLKELWCDELEERMNLDTKDFEVVLDSQLVYSEYPSNQYEMGSISRMAAITAAHELDTVVANTLAFEAYSQMSYFVPLEEIFTAEELKAYEGQLYYTDMASISARESTDVDAPLLNHDSVIDHHNPDTMKAPVATGIFLSDTNVLLTSEYYEHISSMDDFQGFPQEVVFGFIVGSTRLEASKQALSYFEGTPID